MVYYLKPIQLGLFLRTLFCKLKFEGHFQLNILLYRMALDSKGNNTDTNTKHSAKIR